MRAAKTSNVEHRTFNMTSSCQLFRTLRAGTVPLPKMDGIMVRTDHETHTFNLGVEIRGDRLAPAHPAGLCRDGMASRAAESALVIKERRKGAGAAKTHNAAP